MQVPMEIITFKVVIEHVQGPIIDVNVVYFMLMSIVGNIEFKTLKYNLKDLYFALPDFLFLESNSYQLIDHLFRHKVSFVL